MSGIAHIRRAERILAPVILVAILFFGRIASCREIVISEFMAINESSLTDEDGDHSDWIEILNVSQIPINLGGRHLTDDPGDLTLWHFPALTLDPGAYLVVFASEKNRTDPGSELHTNFNLDGAGEYLALVKPDGVTIEHEFAPAYPEQKEDISYGLAFNSTALVAKGDAVKIRVPTDGSLGTTWIEPDYVPGGLWFDGTTGVGFNVFAVETAGDTLVDLSAADLPVGSAITQWPNRGSLGGSFNLTLTTTPGYNPIVEEHDYGLGSAKYVTTTQSIIIELQDIHGSTINAPSQIIQGSDYSIEAWLNLNPAQTDGENTFFAWGRRGVDVAQFDYGDSWWSGAYVSWANGDVGWMGNCGGLPTPGQFHHLAYTNSTDSFNVYLDGSIVYSGYHPNVVPPGDPITVFNIYSDVWLHDGFVGSIAKVRVHDGVLTLQQIQNNFTAEAETFGVVPGPGIVVSNNLIGKNVESETLGINPSVYTRIPFDVPAADVFDALILKMRYDDGFIAYLNGVEIAERNSPLIPLWNSVSTEERPLNAGAVPEQINVTSFMDSLQDGTNVLAVHGLNSDVDDNDFLILPEIVAVSGSNDPPGYFLVATPSEINGATIAFTAEPTFSVAGGFYDAPFDVSISCDTPGAVIRYTLDCSPPGESTGLIYGAPISVTTTTVIRAAAFKTGSRNSDVVTSTYIFLDDVIRQPALPPGYPSTWGPGVADYEMDPNVVDDPLYSGTIKDDLKAVPTLSIAVDKEDFFGPGGIYSNTWAFGDLWERAASVEYLDPNGGDDFRINAGIRIHGGVGRNEGNPKHSLRLLFKKTYGPKTLIFPLFGDDLADEFDSIVLRAGFNFTWNADLNNMTDYIKDQHARDIMTDMGLPASHGRYLHVYINGLYWGLYNVVERPDGRFGSEYFGGSKNDYDVLKASGNWSTDPVYAMEVVSGDMTAFNTLFGLIEQDLSVKANYDAVGQYLDVPGLVDYVLATCFIGNLDSPVLVGNDYIPRNYYCLRKREPGAGFYFLPWDSEFSLLDLNTNRVNVDGMLNPHHLFTRLRANQEFRAIVADHIHKRFFHHGAITPEACIERYTARADEMDRAIVGESARWGDTHREPPGTRNGDWINEINRIVDAYFPVRTQVVFNQFKTAGLYPDLDAPEFLINGAPSEGGTVSKDDELQIVAPSETIYYTLDGSDPRLEFYSAVHTETTLVPENAPKRILIPTEDIGTTWTGTSEPYDDASWTDGLPITHYPNGGVGYERTSGYNAFITYDVENMYSAYTSCFVRVPFTVDADDLASFNYMTLNIHYDDGFVVYINGVKVAEMNAPSSPQWDSKATKSHEAKLAGETFDLSDHIDALHPGSNVVAIHGLNQLLIDPDFLVSFRIVAGQEDQGDLSPAATVYTGPIILDSSTVVKARIWNHEEWSPLSEALFEIHGASPGDIIITEVLPNAVGDDENKEWFEVYNTTDSPIDLDGWTVSDNGADLHTIDNGGPLLVPAKGYLVLGESTDPLLNGGTPVDYSYGNTDITMGNGGDEIILKWNDVVIHAVGYEIFAGTPTVVLDTGQNADPGLAFGMADDYCLGAVSTWQVQSSFYGTNGDTGTPGTDNDGVSVCRILDVYPPELDTAKFARRNLVFLRFNEPLEQSSAENVSNYSIDHGVGSPNSAVMDSSTIVLLEFPSTLTPNTVYTVTITGVEDTQGNPIVSPESGTLSYQVPDVSITEIMYDNRGADVEWIELYNTTYNIIDLSGCYVSDDNVYPALEEGQATLPDGTVIGPGKRIIVNIWNNPDFYKWQMPEDVVVVNAIVEMAGALSNGGDNLVLFDARLGGLLVDGSLSADYPDLSLDGESIEKIDERFPWGDLDTAKYNFRVATAPIGFETGTDDLGRPLSDLASPGKQNGIPIPPQSTSVDVWLLYE